jgi:adenylate cyclase
MRYLKVTLLIAFAASLVVAGLYEMGVFLRLDLGLWSFLGRLSDPPEKRSVVQYIVFCALALSVAWTTIDISKLSLKIVVAAAALVQVISLVWVLNLYRIFFSPFTPALAVVLSFAGGLQYARSEAGGIKRKLRLIFGERLSRKTFYALVNSKEPLNLDGEMREASVVLCEVFNHDELMDALSTSEYVAMTNLFLRNGADFLVERGGYLDECDGESLRVIFGAPLAERNHATIACQAALELVQRLENLNRECDAKWHRKLDFRIGVNSGEMVCGVYGSHRLGTFSVAGEPVEFARRLCSANVIYGSKILIGSCTFDLASNAVEVRPMELVRTRDERTREEVYELLAPKNVLSEDDLRRRDLFWKGIIYYREQLWDDALDHFRAALSANGADAPLEFYIQRIEQLRVGLPALEWNARI